MLLGKAPLPRPLVLAPGHRSLLSAVLRLQGTACKAMLEHAQVVQALMLLLLEQESRVRETLATRRCLRSVHVHRLLGLLPQEPSVVWVQRKPLGPLLLLRGLLRGRLQDYPRSLLDCSCRLLVR